MTYEHLVGETRSSEPAEESISWSTPPRSPNTTGNLSSESEEEEISEPDAAEIERIVSRRPLTDEEWQYRVRWTGYGPRDDLWYTETQLREQAPTMVESFNREKDEAQLGCDMAAMFEEFEKEIAKRRQKSNTGGV